MLLPARVHTVEQRAPRMRLITLTGPALAGLEWVPGQHVRLQVGAGPAAVDWLLGTLRTYSVWDYHDETRARAPNGRGRQTAQVAYGPMLRALPAGAQIFARLEVDWPRRNVITKPFWTPGRKGLD
jgi:hypothetical protein